MFEEDIRFAINMFHSISIYDIPLGEFLITSDNPVLEFPCGENCVRVISWTPSKLIVLSPHRDIYIPTILYKELPFSEMINVMLYSGCCREIYSNHKELLLEKFKEYSEKFNIFLSLKGRSSK